MFAIQKKLKNENAASTNQTAANNATSKKSIDLRQKLLQKEFESLMQLPVGCSIRLLIIKFLFINYNIQLLFDLVLIIQTFYINLN